MEAVFLDLNDSSGKDFNPDCEQDETCITGESKSTSEASATSSKKKRVNSKKRALTKAERKRLSERLHEADLPLLWHQITCKLNESRPTISESNSLSGLKSTKNDSSSRDGDSHGHAGHNDHDKLLTMVLSASTASDLNKIVLHLRDTFVRMYSKCEGRQTKEKYCTFQLEWHKQCSAFLLKNSLPMDTIGLPESDKDLAERRVEWIKFCEGAGVNQEARNRVMIEICAAVYNFLLQSVPVCKGRDCWRAVS